MLLNIIVEELFRLYGGPTLVEFLFARHRPESLIAALDQSDRTL